MSIQQQLKKAKALWGKAKSKKPDFDTVLTDGVYVGKLAKAEIGESQSSGRLQVSWRAVVSVGEFKGESVMWWSGLKTEDNLMYLQRDIARLGKEVPDDISEIEDILKEISKEKPTIRFKVSHSGEYTNVRLVKALGEDEAPEDDDEDSEDGEEAEDPEPEAEKEEEAEPEEEEDEESNEEDEPKKEEEPEEEEEEDVPDLEEGTRVVFQLKGKTVAGEVKSIDYKAEKAKVKTDAGPVYNCSLESLSPEPKTKVKKKKK